MIKKYINSICFHVKRMHIHYFLIIYIYYYVYDTIMQHVKLTFSFDLYAKNNTKKSSKLYDIHQICSTNSEVSTIKND